jgi:hypothetical protein
MSITEVLSQKDRLPKSLRERQEKKKDLTIMVSNTGAQISARTVCRHLIEFGFKVWVHK